MKTRKELKEEYKQRKYRMGVFRITNSVNQKILIGSSDDLDAIWHALKLQLDFGIYSNSELQHDWKVFGADKFNYEILEEIPQKEEEPYDYRRDIKALEDMMVEEIQPFDSRGYNKRKI
jgi:hypothetical protein